MNTVSLVYRRISSAPLLSAFHAVLQRIMPLLLRPAIAGVAVAFIALGVALYIVLLLLSFDFSVRLRDAAAAYQKESEALRRMEVSAREQEAGFAERHRAFLHAMQEVSTLKYLTSENTALSEAESAVFSRP